MSEQTVIWTALPQGEGRGGARLSVLASVRLVGDAERVPTRDAFPDVLRWPELLGPRPEDWAVTVDGTPVKVLAVEPAARDAAGWLALAERTEVRSWKAPEHHQAAWLSWPTTEVLRDLRGVYAAAAAAGPEDHPVLAPDDDGPLAGFLADVGPVHGGFFENGEPVDPHESRRRRRNGDMRKALGGRAQPFFDADRFHFVPDELGAKDVEPKPIEPPRPDLHELLAALADHPALLRSFGFLVDLVLGAVPGDGLITAGPARFPWPDDRRPQTAFGPGFRPKPGQLGGHLRDGFLALRGADDELGQGADFHVAAVDPDGAALVTTAAAATLHRRRLQDTKRDRPTTVTLPGLRTGGLAVLWPDRLRALGQRLEEAAALGLPADGVLHAEQLLRGWRVDVQQEGSREWLSLCRRTVAYEGAGALRADEHEGYVKATSATRRDGQDGKPEHLLHEALVRWDGWSLVAPRPFEIIEHTGTPAEPERAAPRDSTAVNDLGLRVVPRAQPGSLPRMRFGRRYRLRVRAVDLAGGGLPWTDHRDDEASAPVVFRRFEPVPAPDVLATAWFREGESLERLVIRSEGGPPTEDRPVPAPPEDFTARHAKHPPTVRRHVLPPKGSQQQAERHGMLDPHPPRRQHELGCREDAEVVDAGAPQVARDELDAGPLGRPVRYRPDTPNPELGAYPIHDAERLPAVPYLPDPLAAGALLRVAGPDWHEEVTIPWGGGEWWPDGEPFSLELVGRRADESPGRRVEVLEGDRRVLVALAPAEVARVRLSSVLRPGASGELAMPAWAPALDERTVEGGRAWLTTPDRVLVLAHAVQQPLVQPVVRDFADVDRGPGQTVLRLMLEAHVGVRSTGQVDLVADWIEPTDLAPGDPDWEVERSSHAAMVDLPDGLPSDDLTLPLATVVKGERTTGRLRHELGDTKHRVLRYRLDGTTRFREDLPRELWDPDPGLVRVRGAETPLVVLSTAPPLPPDVRYAIPAFGWDRTDDGTTIESVRRGGVLRVYVGRGWWSSGVDERLAVVFAGDANEPHRRASSAAARDPLSDFDGGAGLPFEPKHVGGAEVVTGLRSAGGGAGLHAAVLDGPGPANWHDARKLWFWDIDLSSVARGAYGAFVRLALARYQEHTHPEVEPLSGVVVLDPMALPPTRRLRLTRAGDHLDVRLAGTAADPGTTVGLEWQVHDGTMPGDLGWRALPRGLELRGGRLGGGVLRRLGRLQDLGIEGVGRIVPSEVLKVGRLDPALRIVEPTIFEGRVAVPEVPRGTRRRLVVREHERLRTDVEAGGAEGAAPDTWRGIDTVPASRTVYVEAVEL